MKIKNTPFQARLQYDKPILQKNSNDFDDSDFSFDDSINNEELEIENGQTKKTQKSILKNSSKKPYLNKIITFGEDEDNNNTINLFNTNKHKIIKFKMDDDIYSDKEDYSTNERKELEKTKKIERSLVRSISNKEVITRERLHLAETIKFKNEPDSIIVTDQYGFIKSDKKPNEKKGGKKMEKKHSKKSRTSKSCKDLLQINARMEKWNYMLQQIFA